MSYKCICDLCKKEIIEETGKADIDIMYYDFHTMDEAYNFHSECAKRVHNVIDDFLMYGGKSDV